MTLDNGAIAEQWHVLLPGCLEEGPGVLASVEENLEAASVPGLRWSQESVSTGLANSLLGKRRDALILTYDPTPEWKVVIMANPFGSCLHVSWLVVVTPRRMRDVRRALRIGEERSRRLEVGGELSVFDRLDLAALISLSRHAVKAAIEALGLETEIPVNYRVPEGEPEE